MRERQNPPTICRHAQTIPEMPNMRALSHTYTFSISSQIDFGYPAMTDLGISGNERAPKPRASTIRPHIPRLTKNGAHSQDYPEP
jgi:hypothetical protein